MNPKHTLPPLLIAIAEQAERRAEAIRLQRERIEAARRRLWQRIDHLRETDPFRAAPTLPEADAGVDPPAVRRVAMAPAVLPIADAGCTLLESMADAAD